MSLTRTLTLTVTVMVLTMAVMAGIWSYSQSSHELEELFDAELAQSTRIVQGLVRHLSQTQTFNEMRSSLEETLRLPSNIQDDNSAFEISLSKGPGHKYEKKIAFEIWSADGQPLLTSAPAIHTRDHGQPGYHWIRGHEFSWRTFTLQDPLTGLWIRSAQREDVRNELNQELALGNVLPLFMMLPLLLIGVTVAIQWAFRPLKRLEQPVRNMAPENIHHLDSRQAPKEVSGLVSAVNGLLQRLDDALERERRFSADAAHELRTPLTALRLNLEAAAQTNPETFARLLKSVDRMNYLVEQMLLLSRIDAGYQSEPDTARLSELVEQAIADVAPLAVQKSIELSLEDTTSHPWVRCHSALISTLARSLIANAVQYSPPGSPVQIQLMTAAGTETGLTNQTHQSGFLLRICDAGPGIPEDARERAMSRFVRLDQRQGTGAGLGLAIAARIVDIHKGRLDLRDRSDNRSGLCVEVWLPLPVLSGAGEPSVDAHTAFGPPSAT